MVRAGQGCGNSRAVVRAVVWAGKRCGKKKGSGKGRLHNHSNYASFGIYPELPYSFMAGGSAVFDGPSIA